jgi:hypothetical protein
LPDCWLVVSTHPEGPATGHLDTGFFGFPVIKEMLIWFPNSKLLLHASHAALPILNPLKLSPVVDAAKLLVFKIIYKIIRNSKFRCLFEATSYYQKSSLSHSYQKDERV